MSGRTNGPRRGGIAARPARAGAAQQPEQDRLRLIGPRVAGRDAGRARPRGRRAQRRVPGAARLGLDVPARDLDRDALERDAEPRARGRRAGRVLRAARPQPVIDVERDDARELAAVAQRGERRDERGRVGARGDRGEDDVARPEQLRRRMVASTAPG